MVNSKAPTATRAVKRARRPAEEIQSATRPARKKSDAALYNVENYRLETSVGYLMKRLALSMSTHIEQKLQDQGVDLTNSQWAPMMMMGLGQANTACHLAREFQHDVGAMTRMLDRLEAKGLCQRVRSTEDRRVVEVKLTPAGEAAVKQVPAVIVQVLNEFLTGFSHAEWQTLVGLLTRMQANGLALTKDDSN